MDWAHFLFQIELLRTSRTPRCLWPRESALGPEAAGGRSGRRPGRFAAASAGGYGRPQERTEPTHFRVLGLRVLGFRILGFTLRF